ncbi:MAG: pyrroline-5-carboxylate reductase [Anaerolineaceae bacterium]|nr:pyrroline-5-carboxylate reductase [Anaerolineaceae bacterium]
MPDDQAHTVRRTGFGSGVIWIAILAAAGAVLGFYLFAHLDLSGGVVLGAALGAAAGAALGAIAVWVTSPIGGPDKAAPPLRALAFRLGLIGGGNMAEAIVRGILASGVLRPGDIRVADPAPERRKVFSLLMRVKTCQDNRQLVAGSDVIILAVKPQVVDQVMAEIAPLLGPTKLLVSIAAGTPMARLSAHCPAGTRIVRTMPNTPMLVGGGMVAMSRGGQANEVDMDLARHLLETSATVVELPEEKMDAVTAVSGSGPAYFFLMVEALIEAAEQVGLSHQEAVQLAETTFTGAAKLLASGDVEPGQLRRRVTSPGGTTEAAIASLTEDRFSEIIARAVTAARDRSRELTGP